MSRHTLLHALSDPDVRLYAGVLNPDECAALIGLAAGRMQPSVVVTPDGGRVADGARTSFGMHFERGESVLIRGVERRIADIAGCHPDRLEALQVLRYTVGQQYRAHHDFFGLASPHAAAGGDRVGTCLVYLAQPEAGGQTVLPALRMTVEPVPGHALWFAYPGNDARLLHGGEPVEAGEKWVLTGWVRERPF